MFTDLLAFPPFLRRLLSKLYLLTPFFSFLQHILHPFFGRERYRWLRLRFLHRNSAYVFLSRFCLSRYVPFLLSLLCISSLLFVSRRVLY